MPLELLIQEALKLSKLERIQFVQSVLHSLAEEEEKTFVLTGDMKQELDRRSESIQNGTAKTYTWEEIKAY